MLKLFRKSRSRRAEYRWLSQFNFKSAPFNLGEVLDLGGVRTAEYLSILNIDAKKLIIWNLDPSSQPDHLVDLDNPSRFPSFPEKVQTILMFNLLEHLFRPLEVLSWAAKHLPVGGQVVIVVPFLYPIHPSPKDYWRLTPQCFERFFDELKSEGIQGNLSIENLSVDFRDGVESFSSVAFKAGLVSRLLATLLELKLLFLSKLVLCFGGKKWLSNWIQNNPLALGIVWTKTGSNK